MLMLCATACTPSKPEPLRIGTNLWPGYEPLYLARDKQQFDDSRYLLFELTSATQVMHAFQKRKIDIAALTLDEALLLEAEGIPLKVLLAMDYSNGADAIVASPNIHSMHDLKGKKIGVENTALGAFMLNRALTR